MAAAGSSNCSISESSTGYNYTYTTVALPSGAGPIGILDAPHYDCSTGNLYFVDLFGKAIFRYNEAQNKVYYAVITGFANPSFLIPVKDQPGCFIAGLNDSCWKSDI